MPEISYLELRRSLLSRLKVFEALVDQTILRMNREDLYRLEDASQLVSKWESIERLFPEDFHPPRIGDLRRHLGFSERHDYHDIKTIDLPPIRRAIEEIGAGTEEIIQHELERRQYPIDIADILHPEIHEVCKAYIDNDDIKTAARASVEYLMDEIRKLSGATDDGDPLIDREISSSTGKLCFAFNNSSNDKSCTKGLKLIAKGLYQGVRNPCSHGWNDLSVIEAVQVMTTTSFLMHRLQPYREH